MWDGEKEQENR